MNIEDLKNKILNKEIAIKDIDNSFLTTDIVIFILKTDVNNLKLFSKEQKSSFSKEVWQYLVEKEELSLNRFPIEFLNDSLFIFYLNKTLQSSQSKQKSFFNYLNKIVENKDKKPSDFELISSILSSEQLKEKLGKMTSQAFSDYLNLIPKEFLTVSNTFEIRKNLYFDDKLVSHIDENCEFIKQSDKNFHCMNSASVFDKLSVNCVDNQEVVVNFLKLASKQIRLLPPESQDCFLKYGDVEFVYQDRVLGEIKKTVKQAFKECIIDCFNTISLFSLNGFSNEEKEDIYLTCLEKSIKFAKYTKNKNFEETWKMVKFYLENNIFNESNYEKFLYLILKQSIESEIEKDENYLTNIILSLLKEMNDFDIKKHLLNIYQKESELNEKMVLLLNKAPFLIYFLDLDYIFALKIDLKNIFSKFYSLNLPDLSLFFRKEEKQDNPFYVFYKNIFSKLINYDIKNKSNSLFFFLDKNLTNNKEEKDVLLNLLIEFNIEPDKEFLERYIYSHNIIQLFQKLNFNQEQQKEFSTFFFEKEQFSFVFNMLENIKEIFNIELEKELYNKLEEYIPVKTIAEILLQKEYYYFSKFNFKVIDFKTSSSKKIKIFFVKNFKEKLDENFIDKLILNVKINQ